MSNKVVTNSYFPTFPEQPPYEKSCGVNVKYQTLPTGWPIEITGAPNQSIKHLYSGIPNYYPTMKIARPVNSLYAKDLSQYGAFGKRQSYTYKAYPFTNRNIKEIKEYSTYILPYMDNREWTKNKVRQDISAGGYYT